MSFPEINQCSVNSPAPPPLKVLRNVNCAVSLVLISTLHWPTGEILPHFDARSAPRSGKLTISDYSGEGS